MQCTALTPPAPLPASKKNAEGKGAADASGGIPSSGRNLLDLIRTLEKTNASGNGGSAILDTALSALASIRLTCMRRGLLSADAAKAEQILSKASEGGSVGAGQRPGGGKKRKKGGSGANRAGSLSFVDGSGSGSRAGATSGGSAVNDEGLLLSSLGRILGAGQATKKGEDSAGSSPAKSGAIVKQAADVVTAICRYTATHLPSGGLCASAEYELLLPACPPLLSGIGRTAGSLLERLQSESRLFDDEDDMALASCHRAAASIVCLLGTRLSRSTGALEQVRSSALETLFSEGVGDLSVGSAASLLAALPLAGNSDGVPPAKLWSEAVQQQSSLMALAMNSFLPVFKSASMQKTTDGDDWIQRVQATFTTQPDRINIFRRRVRGYAAVLSSLLSMDGYDTRAESALISATMPISPLLDLVELMLAFPSAAEAKYLSTKSRLRDVSVENGLLSPNSAVNVANTVKYRGHNLFDCAISSLHGSGLVQGKRMIRMACASLQASCSYALRRSVDPAGTPVARTDGKRRRRWLHNSIPLRAMAVKSFRRLLLGLGPSVTSASGVGVSKSLTLVSGCLLEQTALEGGGIDGDADWGTLDEHIDLATASADALASAIAVGGAYLQPQTRSTIESVASTCLSNLLITNNIPTLTYAPTKCSLLKLGTNCVCAPWPDGATSTLTGLMRKVAAALKFDRDCEVSTLAHSALCACDAVLVPRAPPIVVITRGGGNSVSVGQVSGGKAGFDFSSSVLMDGIDAAKREAAAVAAGGSKRKDVGGIDSALAGKGEKRRKGNNALKSSKTRGVDSGKGENTPAAFSEMSADKGEIEENHTVDTVDEDICVGDKRKEDSCSDKKKGEQEPPIEAESTHNEGDPAEDTQDRDSKQGVGSLSALRAGKQQEDEDSEGEMDFPDIVDCGPDEDDG